MNEELFNDRSYASVGVLLSAASALAIVGFYIWLYMTTPTADDFSNPDMSNFHAPESNDDGFYTRLTGLLLSMGGKPTTPEQHRSLLDFYRSEAARMEAENAESIALIRKCMGNESDVSDMESCRDLLLGSKPVTRH